MTGSAKKKQFPTMKLERQYGGPVCGIDEVGRGPLAGPVLAACVYIPEKVRRRRYLREVNDSKKLTAKKRQELYIHIKNSCAFGIGVASPNEIDMLNIHNASLLAMSRAFGCMIDDFDIRPKAALIDGRFNPDIDCECEAVTKGDGISLSIAAASVLAKVTRDSIMAELHEERPFYGWERNVGYGTREHLDALQVYGVTPYHRNSFSPVRNIL